MSFTFGSATLACSPPPTPFLFEDLLLLGCEWETEQGNLDKISIS